MSGSKPTRTQGDLAEMLETLLDKGVVVNADIAVTVGDTELLGVQLRAAIASFETAAEYGLEFPMGTDMERVERSAGIETTDDTETEQPSSPEGRQ
jgi:Gas vesicle protein.